MENLNDNSTMEVDQNDAGFTKNRDGKGEIMFSCKKCGHSLKSRQGILSHITSKHTSSNIAVKRNHQGID